MTEGVVTQGDYIELENGVAGYVIDVGWRSTRLRTWTNNLVVVPNSRFAETIITNYQGPIPAVNIYLTCGVSYDSDLAVVEQVCQEEMDRLLEADPRAVREYGAYFAYESFDDSNITFYLFLQARDRIASFEVQSELIRMVHERFREEGIVINYPMRTINFAEDSGRRQQPVSRGRTTTGRAARGRKSAPKAGRTGHGLPRGGRLRRRTWTRATDRMGGEGPGPDIGVRLQPGIWTASSGFPYAHSGLRFCPRFSGRRQKKRLRSPQYPSSIPCNPCLKTTHLPFVPLP